MHLLRSVDPNILFKRLRGPEIAYGQTDGQFPVCSLNHCEDVSGDVMYAKWKMSMFYYIFIQKELLFLKKTKKFLFSSCFFFRFLLFL
jgi:hypothetical protein